MSNDIFIGLMSGTSVDGLDIVAASFPTENTIKIIAFDTVEFDVQLRSSLSELSESHSLHETLKIERAFSDFTASAVNEFCQSRIPPQASVNGIGFHGHTAFHDPLDRITFQIGDGSWLAAKTKLPVVADIRRKDVAIGGQGAPLAPAFHLQFLNKDETLFCVINIGGIANTSVIDGEHKKLLWGYDTGPGNTLLDSWFRQHREGPYDTDGKWAASGEINSILLERLLEEPYFSLPPPKSTGKEKFNLSWLEAVISDLASHPSPEDVQATLTELTAKSIADEINKNEMLRHCYLCGGGAYNAFMVERIRHHSKLASVTTTRDLGVPPEWVEAAAFAWFAKQRIEEKPISISSVTDARAATMLGCIYLP